jgi:hypothetical protein
MLQLFTDINTRLNTYEQKTLQQQQSTSTPSSSSSQNRNKDANRERNNTKKRRVATSSSSSEEVPTSSPTNVDHQENGEHAIANLRQDVNSLSPMLNQLAKALAFFTSP